jgi:crotonobetaine/carnitine-CoA ligase
VPAGDLGEIVVGGVPGETIMAGYWHDPEATAATIRDGWLHTGDLGRIDERGFLHFVERKALTIKRAGENIAAGEVEQVLLEHPDVAEAAVVGVPDAIRDEAVKAVVVLAPGATTTAEELALHSAARLAPFKVPTVWSLRDELPRNSLGKVEYRRLREESTEHAEAVL